jgi:hypothetical protein
MVKPISKVYDPSLKMLYINSSHRYCSSSTSAAMKFLLKRLMQRGK